MAAKLTLEWNEASDARLNARTHLPVLAEDYFRAGREVATGKHSPEEMHRFRLRTKHFRYTLELFRSLYRAGMEQRLELLKPVQDALGDLNDCATAEELLGKRSPEALAYLRKRSKKKRDEFQRYWKTTFDAPGQIAAWLAFLANDRSRSARRK